jgi:endonuclease/exonuclease/phosphatase family metal-dependent hydrolase
MARQFVTVLQDWVWGSVGFAGSLGGVYDIAEPYGPLIETTVRVLTWNVWGRYGDWAERERGITATLKEVGADIVVLTESWSKGESQPGWLGPGLGLPHYTFYGGQALEDPDASSGIGVMSRWPIARRSTHTLGTPSAKDAQPNQVLCVEIEGPRGLIQVFGVGLDAWKPGESRKRQEQVRDLTTHIARLQDRHALLVLCGDFNADPDSDEIRMLTGRAAVPVPGLVFQDAWETAGAGGSGATWARSNPRTTPVLWPDRRIDYIFTPWPRRGGVGHAVRCELAGTKAVDGSVPSDHYAVLADLRY